LNDAANDVDQLLNAAANAPLSNYDEENRLRATAQRHATALNKAATEQRSSSPPPAGKELNTRLVEVLTAYADLMDTLRQVFGASGNYILVDALKYKVVDAYTAANMVAAAASDDVTVFLDRCGDPKTV